ncbi:MAG: hypothetical protein EOO01_31465, partial [Chitinophagaceae bacterium]
MAHDQGFSHQLFANHSRCTKNCNNHNFISLSSSLHNAFIIRKNHLIKHLTKILILDNYDSFTYNLFHQVKELCTHEVTVCMNDEISVEEVNGFDWIILSPGPGLPKDAGIMPQLISKYSSSKKILGVCLGHQAIAEAFGSELINTEVFH